jgi:hypothetical protein
MWAACPNHICVVGRTNNIGNRIWIMKLFICVIFLVPCCFPFWQNVFPFLTKCISVFEKKYISVFDKMYFRFWQNVFSFLTKLICVFDKMYFMFLTKYISVFGEMYFRVWQNIFPFLTERIFVNTSQNFQHLCFFPWESRGHFSYPHERIWMREYMALS